MTEPQKLLAAYADHGSEEAFREVVGRYLGLVYATALRRLGGDTHAAEDVTQTVFARLARNAGKLARGPWLGGWLHRDASQTAAKVLRARRRREEREREAALMHAIEDHSAATLEKLAPLLDEAIDRLGRKDRDAILLRFFEQLDFRSVAAGLGGSEEAARMRVNRALEKLRLILERQGLALSSCTLAAFLACEAASGAVLPLPSVAGTAKAAAAAGTSLGSFHFAAMTQLKASLVTGLALAVAVATMSLYSTARANQTSFGRLLGTQAERIARLTADQQRFSAEAARRAWKMDALKDLPGLRAEIHSLRAQTNALGGLRDENRRLRLLLEGRPRTPFQLKERSYAKELAAGSWAVACDRYAREHEGLFPETFEQAESYLRESRENAEAFRDLFEISWSGSLDSLRHSAPDSLPVIFVREKDAWQDSDGIWTKVYGMENHSGVPIHVPSSRTEGVVEIFYPTFAVFERAHAGSPHSQ